MVEDGMDGPSALISACGEFFLVSGYQCDAIDGHGQTSGMVGFACKREEKMGGGGDCTLFFWFIDTENGGGCC